MNGLDMYTLHIFSRGLEGGKTVKHLLFSPHADPRLIAGGVTGASPPVPRAGEVTLLAQMAGTSRTPHGSLTAGQCMLLAEPGGAVTVLGPDGLLAYVCFGLPRVLIAGELPPGETGLPLTFQPGDWPALQPMLRRLTQPDGMPEDMRGDALRFLLHELCYQYRTRENSLAQGRIALVQRYLHLHFAESLSIGQLAEAFDYNPTYLARAFRECVGQTIHAYLTQLRVREAARLLMEQPSTIKTIGRAVGYGDEKLFAKNFRKIFGVAPSVYRANGVQRRNHD